MSFLFNDDKSKKEIVVLEGTISDLRTTESGLRTNHAEVATSYDARNYVVIGSMTKANRPGYNPTWATTRNVDASHMSMVVSLLTHQVGIAVFTASEDVTSIDYRVVLMKVA